MQATVGFLRPIVVGLMWLVAGSALAANVYVGDKGGATARDQAAIHEFLSTTGDQSPLASGDAIWTDPLDMAADQTTGDVIVLDLGGAAATHPPRLLRFDGESGVRSEIATGQDLWINPLAVTVDRDGDVIVLDGGGGAVFLEPALLRFDGQTGQRSVIADGQDLWHDAVDLVADPLTGDVFVLDLGGAVALDLPAVRRFDGLSGAASIVAEGADLWYDATRITADANGDAIVLDLGGAAATALPRLLRFAGESGDRTEIATGDDLWYNPIDLDVDLSTGDVVVLDRGGGAVILLPTLRSFDGVTGDASVIAEGTDLWVDSFAVAVVPEPAAVTLCLVAGMAVVMMRRRTMTA
jgi:hypothetical protein